MKIFEKGMKYKIVRYISVFYEQSGFTELFIAFAISIFFIFEYLWIKLNKTKNWNRSILSWATLSTIVFFFVLFLSLKIILSWNYEGIVSNEGVSLYDLRSIMTVDEYMFMRIFILLFQTSILIFLLIIAKIKIFQKKDFYERQYWISSIKVLTNFFIVYGLVGTLKVLMGRDFYVELEEVLRRRIQYSGLDIQWNDNWVKTPEFQPWWTFNGLIGNPQNIISQSLSGIFSQSAFPSGHLAASTMIGMCFIYIIDAKKTESIRKWKIFGVYLYLIHCFMMQITFLINGLHYLSDTSFTFMWGIISIFLTNYIVEKILNSISNKRRGKNENQVYKKQ